MNQDAEISVILKNETMKSLSKLSLILSLVLSTILTIVFFFGAFFFFIIVVQILLMVILPEPEDYAWIEMMKVVGLIVFILLILLIIIGFLIKSFNLSLTGSVAMMLPVFSFFSITMYFYLAGLSAMLLLWLPLLKIFPGLLTLGDILFTPFIVPILFYWRISGGNLDIEPFNMIFPLLNFTIPLVILVLGIFIVFFGTTTWFVGKTAEQKVIDFWIYRYTRHPQYLGFLMLTYGMIVIMGIWPIMAVTPPPTLFWLLAALSSIGAAIREENKLMAENNKEYGNYRERVPFMIPLPRQLVALILAPVRLVLKKNWPENDKEILKILFVYGIISVVLSLPFYFLFHVPAGNLSFWWV